MTIKNKSVAALILCSSFALGQAPPNPKTITATPPIISKEESLEIDLINTKAALIQEQAQGQLSQLKTRLTQLQVQISHEHPGYVLTQQGTLVPEPKNSASKGK